MVYGIIYLLTNTIDGKQYVGQTKHGLEQRFKQHCKARKGSRAYLQKAIAKHGANVFKKDILFVGVDLASLNQAEVQLIRDYETIAPAGYNLRGGGEQQTVHLDTRVKLSAAKQGQIVTESTKEQMSLILLRNGIRPSDATRSKMRVSSKGRPKSDTHRAAISLSMRNRISRR